MTVSRVRLSALGIATASLVVGSAAQAHTYGGEGLSRFIMQVTCNALPFGFLSGNNFSE